MLELRRRRCVYAFGHAFAARGRDSVGACRPPRPSSRHRGSARDDVPQEAGPLPCRRAAARRARAARRAPTTGQARLHGPRGVARDAPDVPLPGPACLLWASNCTSWQRGRRATTEALRRIARRSTAPWLFARGVFSAGQTARVVRPAGHAGAIIRHEVPEEDVQTCGAKEKTRPRRNYKPASRLPLRH